MKKLLSLAIVLFIALSSFMTVSADVIFEPDDDFYSSHRDECEYIDRYFVAAEDVSSLNKPNGNIIKCNFDEGDTIIISHIYKDADGIVWGVTYHSEKLGNSAKGWIPMGCLEVQYDSVSFSEEFGSQFNAETDDLRLAENNLEQLVFWDFPGSENYSEVELWDDSYLDISFLHSYTDENGDVWGYVSYFYGMRGWINIENPELTEPTFVLERENKVLYPESVSVANPSANSGFSPIRIAVILVAAVCAVTAVLIAVFTKKKAD